MPLGTGTDLPLYTPGTQEELDFERARQKRAYPFILSQAPVALATELTPRGTDEAGNTTWQPPAAFTGPYGAVGQLLPALANWGYSKLGYKTNLPPLPGAVAASDMAQKSRNWAEETVPYMHPENKDEEIALEMARSGFGMMIPTFGLLKAVGNVSKPLKTALHIAAPGLGGGPISGTVGALAGGVGEEVKDKLEAAKQTTDNPITLVDGSTISTTPTAPATTAAATTTAPQPLILGNGVTISTQPATPQVVPQTGTQTPDNTTNIPDWVAGLGLLGVAATFWGAAKFGPRTLNVISDALRGQSRNAGVVGEAMNSAIPPTAIEMPLPNDAGGLSRRMAMRNLNQNAVLNELAKGVAPPTEADAMIAANEAINNPANANRRMEGLFRTGVEEGTGHTFPKIVDYKAATDALNPGEQQMAHLAAWAKSELQLRNENIKAGVQRGILPTPANDVDYRVNFTGVATDAPTGATPGLRQIVALAESNPKIVAWLDKNKAIQQAVVDSAETRGMITKSQADRARNVFSDFMPTIDAEGNYLHSWDNKITTPGSGFASPPVPAWEAMIKHFGESIKQMERNDWLRGIVFDLDRRYRADPANFPEVVTRLPDRPNNAQPSTGGTSGRALTINTADGPVKFRINNSALFDSLRGGPQRFDVGWGITNFARRAMQNATTGPLSAVAGAPFVAKTVIRDLGLIPAQAPKGMWRGQLDKLTGMRLPYDPTFIPGTAVTMGKDAATVITKNVADMLGNRNSIISMPLRKYFTDDQVDKWVEWMRAHVEMSNLVQREAQGVGAGGNRSLINMTNLVSGKRGVDAGTFRDPTVGAVSPLLSKPDFGKIPAHIPLPNPVRNTVDGLVRGTVESAINLNTLVKELYGVIADSPHSYIYDLNRTNPKFTPRTLFNAVQEVTGNPGTQGSGKFARTMSQNAPFYNTSLQAMAASLRALRDRPIATGSTVATLMVLGAAATQLSALLSGKEHVDHYENQLANGAKARNITIYHGPGTDPNDHTELPVPNEWQGMLPYVQGLMGHAFGIWNAHSDEDTLARLTHTLAGLFDTHVSTDVVKQTAIGTTSAAVPVDVPPLVSAAVGVLTGGMEPKNIPEQLAGNLVSGEPLLSNLVSGGGHNKVPGQEGADGLLVRSDQGVAKAIMNAFGAAYATAYDLYHNREQRLRADPTSDWARKGVWSDYKQQWQDNTRFGNFIWRNNLPASTYGSLEERTNQLWRPVALAANVSTDLRGEGFSRVNRGVPLLITQDNPVPKDPQMRGLYMMMADTGKAINKFIMPREHDIRAQISNLKESPFMADEKRRIQNKLSNQLYELTTEKHKMLLDLNARMSAQMGGRHVDVGQHIDWNGTVDQFHY